MSKFIKSNDRIIPFPTGMEYQLEAGKVYDLKIIKQWGEVITKFTINGEMNLPKKVFTTKKDDLFIKRVLHSYNNDTKNTTGILLTGDKGSGKTVTAKVIAQKANLPIVVIHSETLLTELNDFFKSFDDPVCILFDEVDKNFATRDLLTFLDGIQKTAKKLVVMTANDNNRIDEFLKNRCSRIRYYRNYNILEDAKEYAEMIAKDRNLENVEEVVNFITTKIKFPSIDNICSFIDEIVFTKEMQLTLDEVLYFMNINVDEKTSPTICPQDDCDDCDDLDDLEFDDCGKECCCAA
jgi:hypothetical protein